MLKEIEHFKETPEQELLRLRNENELLRKQRALFEQTPGTLLLVGTDTRLLYANPHFISVSGYTTEELKGKPVEEILSLVYLPDPRSRLNDIFLNGLEWKGELLTHRSDGTSYWTATQVRPFQNEEGCTEGFIVSQQDISDRKMMELSLLESENKYKTLVESSTDGILIVRNNQTFFANSAFCRMIGYTPSEIYSRPTTDFLHPDDVCKIHELAEKRRNQDYSNIQLELKVLASDGTLRACEAHSSLIQFGGSVANFFTIHDFTERKIAQQELERSEQKYRELADMLPQVVFEIDLYGTIRYLNNAGKEKFGESYLTGKTSAFQVIDRTDLAALQRNLSWVIDEKMRTTGNLYRLIQADGTIFTAMIFASPMFQDGKVTGVRGIVVDISDRLKTEQELKLAKDELEVLNGQLEKRVRESSRRLTEAQTQLINLQKENLQSQYDVLKQQVNPHFLFNSLNVLTSLIKLDPDLAEMFSEQLAKVYRYVLENKDYELVDLNTELQFLENYIFLLNIRFVGKLKVRINIPDERRSDKIIPLAMQLLIENAIKHNTMSRLAPLLIDIFIDEENNLNVVNNLQERPNKMHSTGVGLKNIANRYLLLNNTRPVFETTTDRFVARIPLVVS